MDDAHNNNLVPKRSISALGGKVGDRRSVFGWYGYPVWVQVELVRETEPGQFEVRPIDANVVAEYIKKLIDGDPK